MSIVPQDKPHYTYALYYPEDYPDALKAGTAFYVGKGKRGRIHDHERQARNGIRSHKCSIIRKIWEHGGQVVKRKLAHFAAHEEACQYEIALIFFMDNLANLTYGGDGTVGLIPVVSEETRRKLSEIQKTSPYAAEARRKLHQSIRGRKQSPESVQKRADARRGQKLSPEAIRKMSESLKGRKQSPEVIAKRAANSRGKKRSEEARRNISESLKGRRSPQEGRPLSESQKEALRKANTGKKASPELRRKLSEAHKGKMPSNLEQLKAMGRERARVRRDARASQQMQSLYQQLPLIAEDKYP